MAATQTTKRNGKLARSNGRPAVKMAPVTAAASSTPATRCEVLTLEGAKLARVTQWAREMEGVRGKLRTRLLVVKRLLSSSIDNAAGFLTLEDEVIEPAADLMAEACEMFETMHEAAQMLALTVANGNGDSEATA